MEKTLILAGTAIGCTVFVGLVVLTACGVSMHDQQIMLTQLAGFITTAGMAGVAIWKSYQTSRQTQDNKQAIGVVARVAVDGFAGPPAAKAEAVKHLNGSLPAPGSEGSVRPEAKPCSPT